MSTVQGPHHLHVPQAAMWRAIEGLEHGNSCVPNMTDTLRVTDEEISEKKRANSHYEHGLGGRSRGPSEYDPYFDKKSIKKEFQIDVFHDDANTVARRESERRYTERKYSQYDQTGHPNGNHHVSQAAMWRAISGLEGNTCVPNETDTLRSTDEEIGEKARSRQNSAYDPFFDKKPIPKEHQINIFLDVPKEDSRTRKNSFVDAVASFMSTKKNESSRRPSEVSRDEADHLHPSGLHGGHDEPPRRKSSFKEIFHIGGKSHHADHPPSISE
mmetsp:Transcript_14774/g.25239  ORF Transcript_14774/g.25239 Transcript_14774/m.25239 type:complete len:271 (-) Transcript_14774:1212-2024(-)|eukprot:CAMPEP_0196651502 /NCGR_PEP_ID=MMETSP1086-20130531/445_1 /TAXON_ID=77921 /ORGANISM="Cyanoptyche  gloeocystis , Strain SAG4.97" /LENGTH=270 /DNA_ID=CAMNT_0041981531 /DNA_START=117 /DNA_END=929 /DNA_ORIENTATION=-